MRFTIAKAMTFFGMFVCVGLLGVVGLAAFALSELEVSGPIYSRIADSKDLLADILPPPEYVIEAYLEAHLAVSDPAHLQAHEARLKRLHQDYSDRLSYWKASRLPAELKSELTQTSDVEVQKFWHEAEQVLLPALDHNDVDGARQSLASLTTIYGAHRAVIDDLVGKSNDLNLANEASAKSQLRFYSGLLYGGALLILAFVIAGIFIMRRRVVTPIAAMTRYMGELVEGRYEIDPPYQGRSDEVGDMSQSVAAFRAAILDRRQARLEQEAARDQAEAERAETLERTQRADHERSDAVTQLADSLKKLAEQDLTGDLRQAFPEAYEALREDFNSALQSLRTTLVSIVDTSKTVNADAGSISQAAEDLSRRTEQQAAALEETAAALDQITATVGQTSKAADECHDAVVSAMSTADKSEMVVDAAMAAMGEIEQSSSQISQIIGVIDEIAFQTNLLALNAGVEAARAGDAGRGFAVVAQEVRALAQRSADAAREIKTLISASSGQVRDGVGLVAETAAALKAIVEQVALINTHVSGIAGSAREQSASLHEVNRAINEMDQVTQQNAAMVEETSAASHQLTAEADQLGRLVGAFKMDAAAHPAPGERRLQAVGGRR